MATLPHSMTASPSGMTITVHVTRWMALRVALPMIVGELPLRAWPAAFWALAVCMWRWR